MKNKKILAKIILLASIFSIIVFTSSTVFANNIFPDISISVGDNNDGGVATSVQLIVLFTILTLAPSIIIMLTSFTRIVISLHFLRNALGTQQMPPNQIIIGIALFLTIFIMSPTIKQVNEKAFIPYSEGKISQQQFIDESMKPIREFMFTQVSDKDLKLFTDLAGIESYDNLEDVPSSILIPSFILGEVTKGFIIGFIIYIPFIVIDMVVSSVLMAMGMMMLPPALISAPFKIIFFIMIDGWNLIIGSIVKTFTG
ncbi:flagellar type III secretion system pore protein FliP [[Clostridium] colinum]|uniref:flagellar type III secretion system pore protein FliP n=1 Tax=[Clostridium] colinum TaxID=36835 RepID=UPI002023BEC6|nr:flagellar type III secretion system pore protein FliP [[Clostridium] colinum]